MVDGHDLLNGHESAIHIYSVKMREVPKLLSELERIEEGRTRETGVFRVRRNVNGAAMGCGVSSAGKQSVGRVQVEEMEVFLRP